MSKKVQSKAMRGTRPVARDLTANETAALKGGIVTDNKDPDRLDRRPAGTTGFFRSVGGLSSESE